MITSAKIGKVPVLFIYGKSGAVPLPFHNYGSHNNLEECKEMCLCICGVLIRWGKLKKVCENEVYHVNVPRFTALLSANN
jgi:hypothetical protein